MTVHYLDDGTEVHTHYEIQMEVAPDKWVGGGWLEEADAAQLTAQRATGVTLPTPHMRRVIEVVETRRRRIYSQHTYTGDSPSYQA